MGMRKVQENKVEVDMIPLIDIISLLLMFLVIVGDTAAQANAVAMILPRASEAKTEAEWEKDGIRTEGRITVQIDRSADGKYQAVIQNERFELTTERGKQNKPLIAYLDKFVQTELNAGRAKKDDKGAVNIPVKLRVWNEAPMEFVEPAVLSMAQIGLVDIHYTAQGVQQ